MRRIVETATIGRLDNNYPNRDVQRGFDVLSSFRSLSLAGLAAAALSGLTACGTVGNVVDSVTRREAQPAAVTEVPVQPAGGVTVRCPAVQIRQGTQGVTRYAGGRDGESAGVRHQFSIIRTARDCRFVDGTLFLRIGVAGRVVLGPAGAPGSFSEPMRFVVARGGIEPVYSETQTAQVTVPGGATSAEFDLVDSDIRIEVRPDETVNNFQIFVGFDA